MNRSRPRSRQSGAVTLLLTVTLLMIASIAAISSSRTTGESQLSGGQQYRYQQAFQQAEYAEGEAYQRFLGDGAMQGRLNVCPTVVTETIAIHDANNSQAKATIRNVCNGTSLTGISVSADGGYQGAGARVSRQYTVNLTPAGPGGGTGRILIVTGALSGISKDVEIAADTPGDKGGVHRDIGYGSIGKHEKFNNATSNALKQLTAQEIAEMNAIKPEVTVSLDGKGNVCDAVQGVINANKGKSTIMIKPPVNGADKADRIDLPQCVLNNGDWWDAAAGKEKPFPTLIFDGDVRLQGNTAQFTYINVLVRGNLEGVASLHITGSASGVSYPATPGGVASEWRPGSWRDW